MNSLVSKFREVFPNDDRSDDAILLDLGDKYPDKLDLFPDAKQEYSGLKQRMVDAMAPDPMDYAKNFGGSIIRGVAGTLGGIPKSIAVGGAAIEHYIPMLGKANDFLRFTDSTDVGTAAEDRPLFQLGQKIQDKAPEVVPGTEKSFLGTKVPEALGSSVGFMIGGAAGKLAKIPEALGIAGLGAMTQGVQGYEEAKQKGASDDQAYASMALNMGVGTSEAFPLARMLKRLDGVSGGTFKKALLSATKEGFEEAIQEAFQSAAGDAIAKHIVKYDPDRKMFGDLASDAGAGAVTGFVMSALTHAIGHKIGVADHSGNPTHPIGEVGGTQAATPVDQSLNPLDAYKLDDSTKARIERVLDNELAGDGTESNKAAMGAIYSNPEEHAYLSLLRAQKAKDADLANAYRDELTKQATQRDAARTQEEIAAKTQAGVQEDVGRAMQLAREDNAANEDARNHWSNLEYGQGRERNAQSLISGIADELNAQLAQQQGQDAETAQAAQTQAELQSAAGSAIDQQRANNAAKAVQAARAAAVQQVQAPTRKPWEYTLSEALRAYPNAPASVVRDGHRAWIQKALSEGQTVSPDVMADYPDLRNVQPIAPPVAPLPAAPVVAPSVVNAPQAAPVGPVAAPAVVAPVVPTQVAPQVVAPAVAATHFDTSTIDIGNAGTQIEDSSRGSSKETMPAFYQIADGTVAGERLATLAGSYSDELGETLTRQASQNAKLSRNWTHRLTAFAAPNGSVALLGTFKRSGKEGGYFVTRPGESKSTPLKTLMAAGYKPFASVRTKEAMNNPSFSYQDKAHYDDAFGSVSSEMGEISRTGAAVEEQMTGHTQPEGLAAVGTETVRVEPQLAKLAGQPLFTDPNAKSLFAIITKLADGKNVGGAVRQAISESVEGIVLASKRLAARLIAAGTITNQLDPKEARAVLLKALSEQIENAYANSGTAEEFASHINGAIGNPRLVEPSLRQDRSEGDRPTGAGSAQGSQEAAQGTAAKVAAAEQAVDTNPTEAQKFSGNYSKGHVEIQGLDVTIENPKGATRSGKDASGKPWSVTMPAAYGYIKGTEGIDGDHVDVYIGPNPDSSKVWVVDQIDPKTKQFDEHKSMIGFDSREQAMAAYLGAFSDGTGPARIGEMTQMTMEDFRDWVNEGDTKKPLAYGKKFKPTVRYRTAQESENRATGPDVVAAFQSAMDGLASNGIDTKLITERIGRLVRQFGQYDNVLDAITLSLADIHSPTIENLIYLFHEAGHAVAARETPARQSAIFQAISSVTDSLAGIEGVTLSEANQEERLVESGAQKLVAAGFNPAEARGIFQQIFRFLKDMMYRAMIWVQTGRFGNGAIRPELAMTYFENRLKAALTGQPSMSFLNFIGGRKSTVGEQVGTFRNLSAMDERYDHRTRGMVYGDVIVDSVAAARFKYRTPSFVTDPRTNVSPDIDSTATVHRDVAAQNVVEGVMRLVYDNWTSAGHNAAGLSFEQFVSSGNFINVESMPADVIRAVNDSLQKAGQPTVRPNVGLADLPNDSLKQRAAGVAHRILYKLWAEMGTKRTESEWALSPKNSKNLHDTLARLNQRVNDLRTKYTDADLLLADAKTEIGKLADDFKADVREYGQQSRKYGLLTQVITGIDRQISKPAMTQYESAINRLYNRLSGDSNASHKFMDMLDRVANMGGIDWARDDAKSIRDAITLIAPGDAVLAPLTGSDMDTRALVSVLVAFGKRNSHVMDLLQLRRSNALDERVKVNEALKLALTDSRTALHDARQLVRDLPRLGALADRLLKKLQDHRAEARDLHDEIVRTQTFIDFHHDNAPLWRMELAKLEHVIGAATADWEPTHLAEYTVPASPAATLEHLDRAPKKVFRLTADSITTGALRADTEKMKAWLDAVPDALRGSTWADINQQYEKLSLVDATFNHEALSGSLVNRTLGSFTDRMDYIGTPAARQASRRMRRMTSLMQSFTRDAEGLGFRWGAAEGEAIKLTGLDRDTFRLAFYDRGLKFIENRQDILAKNSNLEAARAEVLRDLRAYLERDPETAALMRNPKLWPALERYYRLTGEASSHLDKLRSEMGIKLLDTSDGYHFFRESIGAPLFTVMRGINAKVERTYEAMLATWGGTTTPKLTKQDVADAYNADRNALVTAMKARFDPDTLKNFVEPLVNRPGSSVFYAPVLPGNVENMAMRERVMKAYDRSGGDMVRFAEEMYRLHAGTSDMATYVGETLSTFQSFFNQIQSTQQDQATAIAAGIAVPPHTLMDARKAEEFPAEWLDYKAYDPHTMKNVVKLLSMEASFGRDMKGMRSDMKTALDELHNLGGKLKDLTEKALASTGGKKNRAFSDELVRLAGGAEALGKLRAADRNAMTVREMDNQFNAILKAQNGTPIEFRPWVEALQTLTAMTVQGPGTAISDTISAIEQPLRKLGVNSIAARMIGRTVRSACSDALGTLAQSLHVHLGINADNTKRRVELGFRDTDATLALKDKFRAAMNMPTSATSAPMKAIVQVSRGIRTVLGSGFGRVQPGQEVQFPTLKPHAAFTQINQHVHNGVIDGLWSVFDGLAARAVNHFESVAGLADMADLNFAFDAKTLGYSKGVMGLFDTTRPFDYLNGTLQRYGFSLETLAREAVERRKVDPLAPILTHHHYQVLASIGQNEITLEANPTNRPPSFLTNPVLYAASPLVGWTVSKANEVVKGFRDPNGKLAWNTFKAGMAAYAAILPLGLAYAWLRDEWDEDVQGKKANVLAFGDGPPYMAMLDKLGRMGTFGIFGDMANSMFNQDVNRQFSVDTRVFFVSSTLNAMQAVGTWVRQGEATYATVGRPLVQALGGSGYLQYADTLNNALGLDNAEARVVKRINVSNYLRAAGREMEMDVRTSRGQATSLPNAVKPYVGEMVLAAYANDAGAFREAYRNALSEAKEMKKEDPEDFVKRSFAAYHPLRATFATEPSPEEYRHLLSRMDEQGRTAVATGIRLFNGYGEQLGIKPDVGREAKKKGGSSGLLSGGDLLKGVSTPKMVSMSDIRQRAVGF